MVDSETRNFGKFLDEQPIRLGPVPTNLLYHIIGVDDLEAARQAGVYELGLDREGFIHLSGRDQVLTPANIWYVDRTDLSLLVIDEDALTSQVVREPGTGTDELFPHLYGPLNLEAIVDVIAFEPDDEGVFQALPDGV